MHEQWRVIIARATQSGGAGDHLVRGGRGPSQFLPLLYSSSPSLSFLLSLSSSPLFPPCSRDAPTMCMGMQMNWRGMERNWKKWQGVKRNGKECMSHGG